MGKTVMDVNAVKALADLPSLDELRAKLIGLLQAPATKIARILKEPGAHAGARAAGQAPRAPKEPEAPEAERIACAGAPNDIEFEFKRRKLKSWLILQKS